MANAECRKFAPNIFNKSKCSNCFRLKEDHSASAIELNKASRKISKCGYLFVAPDWDFSNPINRTKRWQRRWFVLYDDGELTYSVDDHPETIPQACIDMNKVMEVASADDVTGNLHSVAITAPDRVHFVKGTCKEESTWWLEVLQIFPRSSIKTGRAKRNATFPGGISTTYMAQYAKEAKEAKEKEALQTPPVKCNDKTSPTDCDKLSKSLVHEVPVHDNDDNNEDTPIVAKKETVSVSKEPKRELSDSGSTVSTVKNEETQRYKKIKSKTSDGTRAYRSMRSNTCENLSVIPDYSTSGIRKSSRLVRAELPPTPLFSASVSSSSVKYSEPSPPTPPSSSLSTTTSSSPAPVQKPVIQIDSPQTEEDTKSLPSPQSDESSSSSGADLPVRGVPDGCGLDISLQLTPLTTPDTTPKIAQQIPIPSPHELLNLKKGWLMKQSPTKDWHKHWFVLQGTALMYFRDPAAENNGLLDGIIDLGLVQKVEERDVARNYGFIVSTLDERQYVLSAVTHGIRNNWINALKTASNLSNTPETDSVKAGKDSDLPSFTRRNTTDSFLTSTPVSRSLDDKSRSEQSLPISPPLTRTPTSRIKKEKTKIGRAASSSLKTSASLSNFGLQSFDSDTGVSRAAGGQPDDDDDLNMIPERDTNTFKPAPIELTPAVSDLGIMNVIEPAVTSLKSKLDHSQSDLLQLAAVNDQVSETLDNNDTNTTDNNMNNVKVSHEIIDKHLNEISALKKRLENMNADMDTTLKNLNTEQVRNAEKEKQIQNLEQSNSLLQIKCSNAEKSLREQSKEITSLNQKVREFSDLSSQYKSQIIENKTLRQKLEKMERMNNGPNWKTLYESLQEQHNKERGLWENKLKEMELEMQNMIDTNNEAEQKAHIITDLSHQLQDSEQRINHLLCRTDSLEKDNVAIKKAYDDEITRLKENIKELEEYIDRADSEKNAAENSEILRLRQELSEKSNYEQELSEMQKQLSKVSDENDSLRGKLFDITEIPEKDVSDVKTKSRSLCSSHENIDKQMRLTKMDSVGELLTSVHEAAAIESMEHEEIIICYNDVLKRLGKAINEIRSLKNTVRTAQTASDDLEIANIRLNQSLASAEANYTQQIKMLSIKIEDLTSKYLAAEKQARLLKLKCNESKSRRRSSTGLRPDELILNKEAEHVLEDIETNLINIEGFVKGKDQVPAREVKKKSYEISTKASRARRKSSESSELSFVERLKKTDKTIADLNRKLSVSGDQSSVHLETIRKQISATISKYKSDICSHVSVTTEDVDKILSNIDNMVCTSDVPMISVEEPGFPNSDNIASHMDTLMTFLFQSVETAYQMRHEASPADICATKVVSQYQTGSLLSTAADYRSAITSQETSLQAYLLLDLQHQVSKMETKFFAYGREQTLKHYNDVTRTMLLKLLESKHFVPLSGYTRKKIQQLSNVQLDQTSLGHMFRRLQSEAHQVFSNIGSMCQDIITHLTTAIASDVSDKESIVDNIRTEVLNLMEEDDRMREFQTNAVNIFLLGADNDTGKDPERINLIANHEEALQSQTEVARILIDQEIHDLVSAIDARIECTETVLPPTKDLNEVEKLSECIIKIASMLSQKCITEAQITILNTILGAEQKAVTDCAVPDDDDADNNETVANFVFSPDDMNNECNEFMLVLNNYRQQSVPVPGPGSRSHHGHTQLDTKHSSLSSGASVMSLETNLKTLREENEHKKARLSAALDDKKNVSAQDGKIHDLRHWCEKSMTAMEKSYENLLQDLQLQHLKEKDSLRKEKEQALAEETQATLAALDAMRKAHESEVQKEVEKFKKEFLADYQSKACIGALQTEYQTNRNEIKREILSVTGEGWDSGSDADITHTPKLTRSPSCPRLFGTLSLSTGQVRTGDNGQDQDQAQVSPLTGMVANRKRVFENEY